MTFDCIASTRNSLRRYRRTPGLLFAAACFGILLSGCGTGGGAATSALVRSFNTYVPATGANGSLTFTTVTGTALSGSAALGFGQFAPTASTYTSVTSGSSTILANGAGLTAPLSLTTTLNGSSAEYTVVAAGQSGQTNAFVPQLLVIPNFVANQLTIPTGNAAIRVINLSLNPDPIGLYSSPSGVLTAVSSSVSSVSYGYSAANIYVAIPTTQLTNLAIVDVTNSQTALSLSSASNLNSNSFTGGQAYTLYVYGQPGNTTQPLSATWVEDYP